MITEEHYKSLTKALKNTLPFDAKPTRELVVELRGKAKPLTLKATLRVKEVHNSGDISGILCAIDDTGGDEALICALTHLIVPTSHPLYKEIINYQKKRVKHLERINRRG